MSNKNVKTTDLREDYKYIAPDFGLFYIQQHQNTNVLKL